ncbi:MAG: hypothetical protein HOV94_06235 [Saccharothrix sp.]|nr:hypothetical protein [Saccharothrix sp.]
MPAEETSPPWALPATLALEAAQAGHDLQARAHLVQLVHRHGADVMPEVLTWLVDQVVARAGHQGTAQVHLVFRRRGRVVDADEMSPEERWSGRLFAARAAGDEDQTLALLATIVGGLDYGATVGVLLTVLGELLRRLARGEQVLRRG